MNRFFGDHLNANSFSDGYIPKADIYSDDSNFYVEAEVPGLLKENIKLTLHENTLCISGEKINQEKDDKKICLRNERNYGNFKRSFKFSEKIAENAEARYENGILTVTVPKYKKTNTERVININ